MFRRDFFRGLLGGALAAVGRQPVPGDLLPNGFARTPTPIKRRAGLDPAGPESDRTIRSICIPPGFRIVEYTQVPDERGWTSITVRLREIAADLPRPE